MNNPPGMSLLEVMITAAVAIIIFLIISIWIADMIRINNREDIRILLQREVEFVLPILEKDIRNAGANMVSQYSAIDKLSTVYKLILHYDKNNDGTIETTTWEIKTRNVYTQNPIDYYITKNGTNLGGHFVKTSSVFTRNYSGTDPNIVESIDILLKCQSPKYDPRYKKNNGYYELSLGSRVYIRNSIN